MNTVDKRSMTWGIAALAIGSTIALSEAITTSVQASTVEQSRVGDSVHDPIPAALLEDSNHPVAIRTKDGLFLKKTEPVENFNENEITNDAQTTTAKTKVVVQNGDTFVKAEE